MCCRSILNMARCNGFAPNCRLGAMYSEKRQHSQRRRRRALRIFLLADQGKPKRLYAGLLQERLSILRLFAGNLEFYTSKDVLRKQDRNAPKCCHAADLLLRRKAPHPPLEIAKALWPDEDFTSEAVSSGLELRNRISVAAVRLVWQGNGRHKAPARVPKNRHARLSDPLALESVIDIVCDESGPAGAPVAD